VMKDARNRQTVGPLRCSSLTLKRKKHTETSHEKGPRGPEWQNADYTKALCTYTNKLHVSALQTFWPFATSVCCLKASGDEDKAR
jgi:hypothetical protein